MMQIRHCIRNKRSLIFCKKQRL